MCAPLPVRSFHVPELLIDAPLPVLIRSNDPPTPSQFAMPVLFSARPSRFLEAVPAIESPPPAVVLPDPDIVPPVHTVVPVTVTASLPLSVPPDIESVGAAIASPLDRF